MNRSCQCQTAVFATPAARMISAVPWPSSVMSTICARQTCFCGLLRSDTTASKRSRSAGVTSTVIPVRIPPIRMARRVEESLPDSSVRFYPLDTGVTSLNTFDVGLLKKSGLVGTPALTIKPTIRECA